MIVLRSSGRPVLINSVNSLKISNLLSNASVGYFKIYSEQNFKTSKARLNLTFSYFCSFAPLRNTNRVFLIKLSNISTALSSGSCIKQKLEWKHFKSKGGRWVNFWKKNICMQRLLEENQEQLQHIPSVWWFPV